MTIRIERNASGNCINFVGSSRPAYWNACLSARVNLDDPLRVDIINDVRTVDPNDPYFEFYAILFSEFSDADGVAFTDAASCAEYITENANVLESSVTMSGPVDVRRDDTDTTILFGNGTQYGVNSIQAVGNGDGTIDIQARPGGQVIYDDIIYSEVTIQDVAAGTTEAGVVNALNSLFQVTPLGQGGDYAPTYPVLDAVDTTANLAEGVTPSTTKSDNVTLHYYTTGADTGGHGARYWSNETISVSGEYFTVKMTGNGRFILGFADGTTDSNDSGTADDLEELANNTGTAASGIIWSQAIYDYGSYTAPWTWYGSEATPSSFGPGWSFSSTTEQMRYNTDVQNAIDPANGSDGALFKLGIDQNGYLSCWYYDSGRSNDWILTSRKGLTTDGSREYHLVVKLWNGNATLVEIPQIVAQDEVAPTLNYRYIESPDGSFHYPLFATEEEANWVSEDNGGSSASTQQVYIDEPTYTTWYAPQTGFTSNASSAPANTGTITYTEIPTNADNLYAPAAFTISDLTVDELASLYYQLSPQGANYVTTISGQPTGVTILNGILEGTAPEVTGNNVDNPSDSYTITITRTNVFGSASTTFDLIVTNLTAPATAVSGFTWDATSTALVDSDTMADGSVVTFDNTLDAPRRYILPATWVESYVLPALQESGDAIWVGVKDGAGSLTDGVAASDFDAYIKWEWASSGSHTSVIGADTTDTITVNSLSSSFYDYAFEADDQGNLHVIACNVNQINTEPGVEYGGAFSRTVGTTGTDPFTLSMVTVGTQMDLSDTEVSEIVIPQASRWIQVQHTQGGHVLQFKQTGDTGFSGTMPTLQAGYTYRFLMADVFWADQSTDTHLTSADILKFTADGSTEYTTGITRSGAVDSEFAYVEFAVPTDVPPLQWYDDQAGLGSAAGISISGSTYVVPVTGITLEGPAANQTGTNVMDQFDHGWISLDEQLSAGERLVMDNAFWTDFLAELNESTNMFAIGLKGDNWTNTKEVNAVEAASTGEFFKGDTYIVGSVSGGNYIYFRIYSNGVASNQMLVNTTALHGTVCAFLEITSSGDNIRAGFGRNNSTGNITAGDESTVAYADWNAYKGQTGDQGYGITSKDVVISFWTYSGGAIDGADIDWTGLSEVSVPTPAPTMTTSWTKALDFSGGSEYAGIVWNGDSTCPLRMQGISSTVAAPTTAGYTSNDSNARPWATAIVFNIDGNSSNQHIWNQGEGAGSVDDNIYLRVDANRNLYFGWGRSGEINECNISYFGALSSGTWYGVYIASTGERLGSGHTAADIADCFDIRLVNLQTGAVGSTYSVSATWTSGGYGSRMNRSFAGNFTVGGRGGNRNFHGKVASMVVTTLRRNVAMPSDAEISMMVRDPEQWLTDYKVGNSYRRSNYGTDTAGFALNNSTSASTTQVWLMGDGTSDAYALIRNQVWAADQNTTPLRMYSMVSGDIQSVTITGLS